MINCINIIAIGLLTANPIFENYRTIIFDNEKGFEVRHVKINGDVMTAIKLLDESKVFSETYTDKIVRLCSSDLRHQVLARAFEYVSEAERIAVGVLPKEKSYYSQECLKQIVRRSKTKEPFKFSEFGEMYTFCEPEILNFFITSNLVKLDGYCTCFAPEKQPNYIPDVNELYGSILDANEIPTVTADVPFYNPIQLRRDHGVVIIKDGISYRLYLMGSLLQVVVVATEGNYIHPCFKMMNNGRYIWLPSGPCQNRPSLSGRMQHFNWDVSPMSICAPLHSRND
ncbi:hypothetical protein GcC1_083031 [Golovinomyces cichoracearum]|uniref:Uncharacterized protein n=1 Tax=Golovinomyces cichoracearum TaxID=62708 RepID=A0A420IJH6_9PEZI|nr:hypothetical protein GcC1_083031 [Golovinomyces cichoracearum]